MLSKFKKLDILVLSSLKLISAGLCLKNFQKMAHLTRAWTPKQPHADAEATARGCRSNRAPRIRCDNHLQRPLKKRGEAEVTKRRG